MPPVDHEERAYRFGSKKGKAPPSVKTVSTPESAVLNATIRWLYEHKIFCFRQNTGAYKPEGSARYIRYGYPGSPDVLGIMPATSPHAGRFLGIEAKSSTGRQQESQVAFQKKVEDSGGLYFVVRSVDDLERQLKPLLHTASPPVRQSPPA